jgi:hypothetical protein
VFKNIEVNIFVASSPVLTPFNYIPPLNSPLLNSAKITISSYISLICPIEQNLLPYVFEELLLSKQLKSLTKLYEPV